MMDWLIDTFLWTGALIAFVLLVRRPVARVFGPKIAYALWALPFLRLLMPPITLPSWMAPEESIADNATFTLTVPVESPTAGAVAAEPVAVTAPWITPSELLLPVWIGGAAAFIIWRLVEYRRMKRELQSDSIPVGEEANIRLIESETVSSPVAFGVRDKVIALPSGFMASEDRHARDLAIAHEVQHHRGGDLIANFAAQTLLAMHWFNPLAWAGWRAMRRDQEAACDARVVELKGSKEKAAYGEVIASFAAGPRLALAAPMACPVLGEKSVIHRLRSLNMSDVSGRRRITGRAALLTCVLALPLTATVTYASEDFADGVQASETAKGESYTIIDVEEGASPDDASLHTRVIERDGKRFVLKTSEEITEEEAEARIAKAEASRIEIEEEIETIDGASSAEVKIIKKVKDGQSGDGHAKRVVVIKEVDGGDGKKVKEIKRQRHVFVADDAKMSEDDRKALREALKDIDGDWEANLDVENEVRVALAEAEGQLTRVNVSCEGDKPVSVEDEGKGQTVFVCKSQIMASALSGLKAARDQLATDGNLPDSARDEVLRAIDQEISRLQAET